MDRIDKTGTDPAVAAAAQVETPLHKHTISNRGGLDIVDGQIHLMPNPDLAGTMAAMDALGIRTAVVDEFWFTDSENRVHPSLPLSNGAYRPVPVNALEAVMKFPHRFAFVQRITRNDPGAHETVATVAQTPGGVGIRIILGGHKDRAALEGGDWDHVIAAAQEHGLPVNLLSKHLSRLADGLCARFPDLRLIVDHCGWCDSRDDWSATLRLADCENVFLKWSHPDRTFRHFDDAGRAQRRGLVDALRAFGPDRVFWASDVSHEETAKSWMELLTSVHGHPELSKDVLGKVLGKTARALYGLSAPRT